MSKKEIVLSSLRSMPSDRPFTRNDLFLTVCELVQSSTFSFIFNQNLVGKDVKVVGKIPHSRTLMYKREH
jgi:hypothetical protein